MAVLTIKSTYKTHTAVESDEFYEVVFASAGGQPVAVQVNANDSGIAVVEAYLHLQSVAPGDYYAQTVRDLSDGPHEVEAIDKASNILLAEHLTEQNRLLVACFISLCNGCCAGDTAEEVARELLNAEINCNTVNGELYHYRYTREEGAQLSIGDIKKRCGYIWQSHLFLEGMDVCFGFLREFYRLESSVKDPQELLFWTFLMCLFGGYDCQYPYTLFLCIKENRFGQFLAQDTYPAIREAFLAR